MIIFGTKFLGHDSALYRIDTSEKTLWAVSTERLTRKKHDSAPASLLRNHITAGKADVIAFSFNDFSEELLGWETKWFGGTHAAQTQIEYLNSLSNLSLDEHRSNDTEKHELTEFIRVINQKAHEPDIPKSVFNRTIIEATIRKLMGPIFVTPKTRIECHEHHLCHAISAYYASSFYGQPSLVVTIDGMGDGIHNKAYIFRGEWHQEIGASEATLFRAVDESKAISIGHLYLNFTVAAGFRPACDEGKIEALAAFGKPIPHILNMLHDCCIVSGNAIHISPKLITPFYSRDYLEQLIKEFGINDYSATIQKFLEDIIVEYLNALSIPSDIDCLCLAGGVTANIIMNLKITERTKFKKIHIAPYMSDEGTACGAAILSARTMGEDISWITEHKMPYLGPSYSREDVLESIRKRDGEITYTDLNNAWPEVAAQEVAEGRIIGIFQGRMEFGPRALGNRSILANPADPTICKRINVSIKRRPPWQPFCPSILESERERLFGPGLSHKYMALGYRMKSEFAKALPSAVHIDGTARPQFVSAEDNPCYYRLLKKVQELTGYGVVINTSFNLHGRAIVMTPDHAIDDFLDCNLETLFIEGFQIARRVQG